MSDVPSVKFLHIFFSGSKFGKGKEMQMFLKIVILNIFYSITLCQLLSQTEGKKMSKNDKKKTIKR